MKKRELKTLFSTLFLAVTGCLLFATGAAAATLTDFTIHNGHTYAVIDESMSWTSAEAFAVSQGGHLVTINDADENQWVYKTFAEGKGVFWIGLEWDGTNPITDMANWYWASGEANTYTNFRKGQPDLGDPYAVMNSSVERGPGWDNYPDDGWIDSPRGIVEIDAVPIPGAVWLLGSGLIGLVAFGGRRRKKNMS